ncbi:MAG: hypothetical protein MPK62_05625 [Alphaproteobacteria bacterium]|nr:hypothetical protein [Alphaproteobacteria bacterium]MDA8030603.1 hypothetical protein [Alphaproteobacteria bacterium]
MKSKMVQMMDSDKKTLFTWGVVGAVLFSTLASFLVHDYLRDLPKPGCPKNHADLQSHTVYILDFSDPVTRGDAERIVSHMAASRKELPVRGKLTALFVNADTDSELYAVCKPPIPGIRRRNWECEKLDELAGIDLGKKGEAERFCKFEKKMHALVADVMRHHQGESPSSPLIEELVKVTSRPDFEHVPKKEIVLYSDLLQNTRKYSFYEKSRGSVPVARSVVENEKLALAGAAVSVHQIRRKSDNREMLLKARAFWQNLFDLAQTRTLDFSWIE